MEDPWEICLNKGLTLRYSGRPKVGRSAIIHLAGAPELHVGTVRQGDFRMNGIVGKRNE